MVVLVCALRCNNLASMALLKFVSLPGRTIGHQLLFEVVTQMTTSWSKVKSVPPREAAVHSRGASS